MQLPVAFSLTSRSQEVVFVLGEIPTAMEGNEMTNLTAHLAPMIVLIVGSLTVYVWSILK